MWDWSGSMGDRDPTRSHDLEKDPTLTSESDHLDDLGS